MRARGHDTVRTVRDRLILAIHLVVTFAKLLRPGGLRAVAAEPLLLKHLSVPKTRSAPLDRTAVHAGSRG